MGSMNVFISSSNKYFLTTLLENRKMITISDFYPPGSNNAIIDAKELLYLLDAVTKP